MTTGLQGQAKTAKIEVQGPGHTRRDVNIVTEQRVTKRRWWSFLGPNFSKKGSEIWNGDVYRLHKDIAAGKHAKGVKVKDGKITVTDPTLSGHVNGLLDAYNHLHKHQGKTMTLPNGKKVRVIVNEKTRQAFTWGVLKLLRDGPSSRLAKSFRESDFKPPRLQDIFYNVNFEYNQEVNKTVQRSKRYWPL